MPMSPSLRETLLALRDRDLTLRDELQAAGTLFEGYHPRMEAVHRDNAKQLRALIAEHGWPNQHLVCEDGAEAAWLIAQHSISEPSFMRACRDLLEQQSRSGGVPFWQFAYIDDRVRSFEGKPQRFGTQVELTPEGPVLCEVEDAKSLEQRQRQAGISTVAARLQAMENDPRPTPAEFAARKYAELQWRLKVGWCAPRVV